MQGDTDSIFCNFEKWDEWKNYSWESQFDFGKRLSAEITTALFKDPILLDFEKIMKPFLLFGKKRYVGHKYEEPHKHSLMTRGIVLQRRDNFLLLRRLYEFVMTQLLENRSLGVSESVSELRKVVDSLVNGTVDVSELAITKALTKEKYEDTVHAPHVELAKKLRDRGIPVRSNDRLTFVILKDGDQKNRSPAYKRAESLDYVIENNLKIDAIHYLNLLRLPITQLLELVIPLKAVDHIFDTAIKKTDVERRNLQTITSFFKPVDGSNFDDKLKVKRDREFEDLMQAKEEKKPKTESNRTLDMIMGLKKK